MKSYLSTERVKNLDPGDMLGKTLELGTQLERGLQLGKEFAEREKLTLPAELDWYGLGGSAIVGDLIEGFQLCPVPLRVWRQPSSGMEPRCPRVVCSYSGNTIESLRAFEEGVEVDQIWLTVSSGGRLAEMAADANIPHLMLPTGYPPRAAVGFGIGAFMALFSMMRQKEVAWSSKESRILAADAESYQILDSEKNPALRLAETLVDKTPIFYAVDPILGPSLIRRASAQMAENAKRWSHTAVLPELAHNEVEAFPALATLLPPPLVLFVGTWPFSDFPYSCSPIETLLSEWNIPCQHIEFASSEGVSESNILTGMRAMLFIDTTTVYLALILATDPLAIPTITRLKSLQKSS